jgi:hypothetical protein
MLSADWLEFMAKAEREIASRPEGYPKPARPVKKLVSRRQRQALSGSGNTVKAIYTAPNMWNQAQTIDPNSTTFTTNLGGNCEPDNPHGKSTRSRS